MSPFAANMLSISYEHSWHRNCAEFGSLLQHHVGRAKIKKTSIWDGESVELDSMAFVIGGITIYHGNVHACGESILKRTATIELGNLIVQAMYGPLPCGTWGLFFNVVTTSHF